MPPLEMARGIREYNKTLDWKQWFDGRFSEFVKNNEGIKMAHKAYML
jgi:hypothetical protein